MLKLLDKLLLMGLMMSLLVTACTPPAASPAPTVVPTESPTLTLVSPTATATATTPPPATPTPKPDAKNLRFATSVDLKDAQTSGAIIALGAPRVLAAVDVSGIPADALITWQLWRGAHELLNTFKRTPVTHGMITQTLLSDVREALPGKYRLTVKAGTKQVEGNFTISAEQAAPDTPLIEENFNDNVRQWSLNNSDGGWSRIVSGQLLLQVDIAKASAGALLSTHLADFDMSVVVSQPNGWHDGYYILSFRDTGEAAYAFSVSTSGSLAIGYAPYGGQWSDLIPAQYTAALKRGAANRLRVAARGDQFSFYINDVLVATAQDDRLQAGGIGMYAGTYDRPGLHATYDDLVVGLPKGNVVVMPTKIPVTVTPKPTAAPKTPLMADAVRKTLGYVDDVGGAMDRLYHGSGAEGCKPLLTDYFGIIGAPTYDTAALPATAQNAYGPYRAAIDLMSVRLKPIASVCLTGGGSIGKLDFDTARTAIAEASSMLNQALGLMGQ